MRRTVLLLAALLPLACHTSEPPPPAPAAESEPTGAQLTFQSTPPGAHVTLDGAALTEVTPFTRFMKAGAGHHTARFELDGYEPRSEEFLVGLAADTVATTLQPAPKVHVVTDPPGAQVALDGVAKLAATPGDVTVPSGEHDLVVSLAGRVPVKRHLGAKDRAALSLALAPAALVDVTSEPSGATVLVDGVDTGRVTPATGVAVAAGKPHLLSARQEKLRALPVKVKALKPGQTQAVALKLLDLGRKQLLARRVALKKELARLEADQRRYEKKTAGFVVASGKGALADEQKLQEISDRIEAAQSELADLNDQLDGEAQ